jgi:hypothetical protein
MSKLVMIRATDLGDILLIHQDHRTLDWQVLSYSKAGRKRFAAVGFKTRADAAKHRQSLFRLHERLAKQGVR